MVDPINQANVREKRKNTLQFSLVLDWGLGIQSFIDSLILTQIIKVWTKAKTLKALSMDE